MNKKIFTLLITLLLIVLFAMNSNSDVSEGCCFLNRTGICEQSTEDSCNQRYGEFFGTGSCTFVEKCRIGCCCAALPGNRAYPVRKGGCMELFKGLFLEVNESECNTICAKVTPETPLCSASCQPNTKNCIGRGGTIINQGSYYCWENDIAYPNQVLCNDGCSKIVQCDLELEITGDCYCGGNLYSSGFCCWNNAHTSDTTGSDCPAANECEKYPGTEPFFSCCDACKDDLQHWSPGDTSCIAGYGTEKGLCCQECAPSWVGCCDNEWQCEGNILNYIYASCPGAPCDNGCIVSVCILNEIINSGVNPYPMCECAGGYYDTLTDSRYCCPTGPASSCEIDTFNLEGYVYSIHRSNKVSNANVKVETTSKEYTITTDGNGEYLIENIVISSGKFNVSIMKEGYYPKNLILDYPAPSTTLNRDFNITPVGGVCDEINPPTVDIFEASSVKGKKEINLTWKNPCSIPSKVIAYSIAREPGSHLGTFYTSGTSFIDSDVEWSDYSKVPSDIKTYTYYIRAHYVSGKSSSENSTSITMGHGYCEGIFDNEEFCLSDALTKSEDLTKRYTCDAYNDLTQQGIKGILDCFPGVCVGPNKDGITDCKISTNCNEGGNPFGLFYTQDSCLAGDSYCYYDCSDTTVDSCENCSAINDCYGYRSENACLTDNCLLTGVHSAKDGNNNPCVWESSFKELGKGFCYDEDYRGTDNCGLCNKDSGLFYNLNCDQSTCTKLGLCYSFDNSCEQCLSNTKCEDFESEESCANAHSLGIRNVNIGECPTEIIRSDDACNLGACKWAVPTGHSGITCFKDANDDNIADCDLREGIDHACKEDFEPFSTIPQVDIPKIGAEGYDIHFYLTEGGTGDLRSFYFCIDKNNSCCPKIEKIVTSTTREVVINPLEGTEIITEAGTYFIRYYSVDRHSNVELVKSTEFFVDPNKPKIVFDHYFYRESNKGYTVIIAASDKYVSCDYNLNGISEDKVEKTNFDAGFNNTFFIRFKELDEGNYVFSTTCYDHIGNSVKTDYEFYVNFIYQITVGSPNLETLNAETVNFHLTTTDDSDCTLEAVNASVSGVPYNLLPGEPVGMDKVEIILNNLYDYTKTLTNLEKDVSYVVRATCIPLIAGKEDSGIFHFTIDKQAPVTSTSFDFDAWHKKEGDLLTIKFDCNDPEIKGTPGEAGCNGTYLCVGLNCHLNEDNYNLLLNDEYQTDTDQYISYFSVDNIGNKEDRAVEGHYNQRINIDEDNPQVSITSPTNQFTSSRYQTMKVTASDTTSYVNYVQIKVEEVDPPYESSIANATMISSNKYELDNVRLYNGLNLITATACDKALNCEQDTHEIYLDIYPPEIIDILIEDSDLDLDTGNIFEYKEDLFFTVKIEDKYLHLGDNLRTGIGVDPDSVKLTIYKSNGDVVTFLDMVAGKDNYYYQNMTELPLGEYNVTIGASDYFGNYDEKTVPFEIRDTIPPSLTLIPDISIAPLVIYTQSHTITGTTDPNLPVMVTILDENDENPMYSYGNAGPEILPKEEFLDMPMTDLFHESYPKKGDIEIKFSGDWSSVLSIGDYLEFSNQDKIPRYRIQGIDVISYGFESRYTKITLDTALEDNVFGSDTISAFTSPYPSGWFSIPVDNFRIGTNKVWVSAKDTSNQSVDILVTVISKTGYFDIILTNPSDAIIDYNDFVSAGNKIILQVKTEKDGADFEASCKINHIGNDTIADEFRDIPMATTDDIIHTFTIDSALCKENEGHYCLIGATEDYPINYHHYMINCTSTKVDVNSSFGNICFTVAAYAQQEETNICPDDLGECGSYMPPECAGTVNCTDEFHKLNQDNCIAEGICKWSPDYGCDIVCYPGFTDDDNDGVCDDITPPGIEVIYPKTGVTDLFRPTIRIKTTEPANCELRWFDTGIDIGPFVQEGGNSHSFTLTEPLTEGQTTSFNISCVDLSSNKNSMKFDILLDRVAPKIISLDSTRGTKLDRRDRQGKITSLLVETTKETICRQKGNKIELWDSEPDYDEMTPFSGLSYNQINEQDITSEITDLGINGDYRFYVMCEAKNGLKTTLNFTEFSVYIGNLFWITKSPEGVISNKDPLLEMLTNQICDCEYNGSSVFEPFGGHSDYRMIQLHLTEERDYNYLVRCYLNDSYEQTTDPNNRFETNISFTLDMERAIPVINSTFPENNSIIGENSVEFTGYISSVTEFPIIESKLEVNGVNYTLDLIDGEYSYLVTFQEEIIYTFTIWAKNSGGFENSISRQVEIDTTAPEEPYIIIGDPKGVDNPPVADAGEDRTVDVDQVVSLNGLGSSDPDDDPLTYRWSQLSGPAATLNNPLTAEPIFIPQTAGTYVFSLVVNDGYLDSQPDNVVIHVSTEELPYSCEELSSIINVSYTATCQDSDYNKTADVDNDGDIDIYDLTTWGLNSNNETWCDEQLADTTDPCEIICTDSDGGQEYYIKGTTSSAKFSPSDVAIEWTDLCLKDYDKYQTGEYLPPEGITEENGLLEGACPIIDEPGTISAYECPNGCSDGVCIQ